MEHERCTRCGETYYSPDAIESAQLKAANQVREADGLLFPDEIKAIRGNLNLSQSNLEKLLGLGEKSVVRWERGYVFQSKAADMLLRLVRDVPGVATALAAYNGVSAAVSPYAVPEGAEAKGSATDRVIAPGDINRRLAASRGKTAKARSEYVTPKGAQSTIASSASREAVYKEGIG